MNDSFLSKRTALLQQIATLDSMELGSLSDDGAFDLPPGVDTHPKRRRASLATALHKGPQCIGQTSVAPLPLPAFPATDECTGAIFPEIDVLSLGIKCLRNSACTLPAPTTPFTGSRSKCE